MKQDDELWMKKLKEVLADYEEPAPLDGWARLENKLLPPAKRVSFHRWWAAAAAILLLMISGVSFYFLQTPIADEIRLASVPELVPVSDKVSVIPQPDVVAVHTIAAKEITPRKYTRSIPARAEMNVPEESVIAEPEKEKDVVTAGDINNRQSEQKEVKPSGRNKWHLPVNESPKDSSKKKWSVALSVNAGVSKTNDPFGGGAVDHINSSPNLSVNQFANASDGMISLSDKYLVLKEGNLQVVPKEYYDHRQPITVGASVRKEISNGFSIETGLSYTLLKSDISRDGKNAGKSGEQKLHYIGIPLQANWSFVNSKNFTLYLSAGGMVEKCVYGKTLDKKNTVKPLQFSLVGGLGAQYNISKQLGLYVEPGVSHFFDDGSDVETIRKENPLNFNLRAGIRFTY
ncbi:PorT family protein [Bacteroides sp. OttesenSCG-928-D19]|nr:PorT family protein [Bacteroides sp. OttesenSCG-928-D19]